MRDPKKLSPNSRPFLPRDPSHVARARALRRDMTPAERSLWYDLLRDLRPRFHRQRPIADYIVDFYCPACRLVIEVDGESHFTEAGMEADRRRTEVLEELGLKVVRFTNLEVTSGLEGVRERILEVVACRSGGAVIDPIPPTPL